MTFTFKLSRRWAMLPYCSMLLPLLLSVACASGDLPSETSTGGPPEAISAFKGWRPRGNKFGQTYVALSIVPDTATLPPSGVEDLSAIATTSSGARTAMSVTWRVSGGTIDSAGTYRAPPTPGRYAVIGSNASTGLTDTALVTVSTPPAAPLVSVRLVPGSIALATGGTVQFSVSGSYADGSVAPIGVTYTATGGTIAPDGSYSAGTAPGKFAVVASSAEGPADTATVTLSAPMATVQRLVLSPGSATLLAGATQRFSTVAQLSDGTTVPLTPTYSATGGSITAAGDYTAGGVGGSYAVIARDAASGKADTALIAISPPAPTLQTFTLTPTSASMSAGAKLQFAVAARWTDGSTTVPPVTYSASGGSVTTGGLYTAGSVAGTFRVIATQQQATTADTATVTITAPPPPSTSQLLFDESFESGLARWQRETCCNYSAVTGSSPLREGSTSLRVEVNETDPLVAGRTRAELLRPQLSNWTGDANGPFGVGDEVWYGFSVYIPTTWTDDGTGNQSTSIQQLHDTPDPDASGNIDWSKGRAPILSFQFDGSNWMFVSMSGGPYPATPVWHSWNGGAVAKGAWTDFVVHAKWYNDSRGVLQIWKNGTQVVNATGPNTLENVLPAYFKLGIHKWIWNTPSVTSRTAYYDALRIAGAGGSYSAVAPR